MVRFHYFVFFTLYCVCTAQIGNPSEVLEMFAKVVNACRQKNNVTLLECVKERSFIALDNLYRSDNVISIVPNLISIVPYDDSRLQQRSGKKMLADLENEDPVNKSLIIGNLIAARIYDFVESRAVSVKVPITTLDIFNVLEDGEKVEGRGVRGGRGKKDKGGGMMMMGAMFAGTMMAMKLAAVAAMAGKALMASMMATLLAALAALSKKSGTHGSTYEVINVPSHGNHARRSIAEAAYANQQHQHSEMPQKDQLEFDIN